ncbi:MAG: hypothetical protein M3P14_00830 [Chloroflexota bacterium]|nr:hypothetical protein [Chloroflexota bacterium]
MLLVAAAACLVAPATLLADVHSPLRVAATLVMFCLAPGAAALPLLTPRTVRVELAIVFATSLGFLAVAAQTMLWLHRWAPETATYGVAVLCLAAIGAQLLNRLGHRSVRRVVPPSPAAQARRRPLRMADFAAIVFILIAAACWAVALHHADLGRISGYGLLAALPPTYYLALGILACGFALLASRRRVQPVLLGTYVVGLVVMLHATTAILYAEPRYAWTYKHLGVIDYIATHGEVHRSIDIYNNWPGFFALNAWFSKLAGVAPIDYAAWAQVFFELANVAAILFALRGVTRNPRLQWTAAWLFIVGNWIGQDYLAPQAFTFFLVLVILGLVVRCAAPATPPHTRVGRRLKGMIDRTAAAALRGRSLREPERAGGQLPAWAALLFGGLCYLAVVVSHQLSPIMLILSVAALALATRRPPLWVLAGLVAIEAWWLALGYDFVSKHFQLFDVNPSASARPSGYLQHGLPGVALGADASRAAIVVIAVLAVAGVVRRLRAGHWDVTPAALAVAPVIVVTFQSYGGEGPLRAFLFALPWLAFFAAAACSPARAAKTALGRSWRLLAVSCVVGVGTLFGYFGQEMINHVVPDDVAASRWYLDHAPRESSLTYVAPNFPERLNARYVYHLAAPPALTEMPGFRPHLLGARDVHSLESLLGDDNSPRRFVALSPSQERYARLYRLTPPGSFAHFARALLASPDFELVYRRGFAFIFLFAPRSRTPVGPAGPGAAERR